MALKIEIHKKENVRPFSPTPQSLTNYKLSILDQMVGSHYTPIFFFYNSGSGHHDYEELKQSLSKTLSILYPLAGRIKDVMTIECNDKGVDFVRANVTNWDLSDFLRVCNVDLLHQLLPRDPYPVDFDPSQPMLAVQVNEFRCGGTAVAICLWHGVADAAALAGFVRTWASINNGSSLAINKGSEEATNGGSNLVVDAAAIFPAVANFDFSSSTSSFATRLKMSRPKFSSKRFVFRPQEIERMRNTLSVSVSDHRRRRPTRVEALSAFLWAAVIRANNQPAKTHILTQAIDLRTRLNPPFPSMCLGNILQLTAARWTPENAAGAESLVGKVREAILKVTDDYLRKIQAQGGFLKALNSEVEKIMAAGGDEIKVFSISSLCGFPFDEVDFGWGKPVWFVAAPFNLQNSAYLHKTCDGGIEVLIGLTPQVMASLEKDKEFLAHVSCCQSISELPTLPSLL